MLQKDYMNIALNRDILSFTWRSKDLKLPRDPEFYLATNGTLGFDKIKHKWKRGQFTGVLDEEGDFETYVAIPLSSSNPGAEDMKNHERIIVCRNNPLCLPNTAQNEWFAKLKAESDTSLLCMILLTRLSKIIEAFSDAQKNQIEAAFKNIKEGLPVVITSSLIEDLKIQELTDPDFIDKIQYISGLMQEIDKREANLKGIDLELLDKRAQVTSNELKQYDDITTLDYLTRYVERLRFVEEMKENGFDIEIVPNPIFFDEPKKEDIDEGTFESKEAEEEELPEENNEEEEKKDDTEPSENNEE